MVLLHKKAFALLGLFLLLVVSAPQSTLFAGTGSDTRNAAPANTVETFVFQVGIDKYTSPNVRQLDGSVQHVLDKKKLLIRRFNVPADHFLTLTNEQATHEGIIAGFRKQLIDNARSHRNATVIFQYSGHGSRVKDRTGTKARRIVQHSGSGE